ncbi:MAG: thermostable hemolysin [Chromatiales bacterium]|jgi:hypothetical protein
MSIQQPGDYLHLHADHLSVNLPSTQRLAKESFIRDVFARSYDADIRSFMPILLSLQDSSASLKAVLGLRPAREQSLFLEVYLPQPVEHLLSRQLTEPVKREDIIELGNLAIEHRGLARSVILTMTAFLHAAEYSWVVFTIGPLLINSFTRLGLPLLDLGPATREHLPEDERAAWGRYYDQSPRVMACSINQAHRILYEHCTREQTMLQLWQQAQLMGRQAA